MLRDPIDWSLVYASFSIDPNAVMVYEHSIATYGGMYELGYQRLKCAIYSFQLDRHAAAYRVVHFCHGIGLAQQFRDDVFRRG